MSSFSQLVVLLSLLATTSVAAADEPPELHTGAHALIVKLKMAGKERELYHDVWIRSEEGRLSLEVRKDPPPIEGGLGWRLRDLGEPKPQQTAPKLGDEQPKADDARPMPPSKPKTGWGSKMGGPHDGQEVWLAKGREFTGLIDEEGKIQFGITLVREGKIVSLHFAGRPNGTGAKGNVRLLTVGERPFEVHSRTCDHPYHATDPQTDPLTRESSAKAKRGLSQVEVKAPRKQGFVKPGQSVG